MVKKFGTRSEVVDGLALSTRGGLKAEDLIMNRSGKIVSKRKSIQAKATYAQYGFRKREREPEPEPEPTPEPVSAKKKRRRRKKKDVEAEAN